MGLNDLKLSSSIIATLYPATLINIDGPGIVQLTPLITPEAAETIKEPAANADTGWKYLGHNKKSILIVVNYDAVVHLPDEELSFLTNMLLACKLSLADVAIVNKNNYKASVYKDFIAEFKSKTVFLFGIEPSVFGLPVSFPYYQVQSVANCTFLYTPALEEQRTDALLKSKLWISLRSIFNI
jgi:hypothetical protein